MNEIIKVTESKGGKQVVSALELYDFLEIKTTFAHWIKRMLDYGFTQNIDYQSLDIFVHSKNGIGGVNKTDYILTLDTAKEISMIQRSEKGKQARQYFIACEKKLREIVKQPNFNLPTTFAAALRLLADTTEQKERAQLELKYFEGKLKDAQSKIKADELKVVFANSVEGSTTSILVRQFSKDLSDNTFKIGQNQLFDWFKENNYLQPNNEPYQRYINQGLFEVITRSIGSSKDTFQAKTTKITGKGAIYFSQKIKINHLFKKKIEIEKEPTLFDYDDNKELLSSIKTIRRGTRKFKFKNIVQQIETTQLQSTDYVIKVIIQLVCKEFDFTKQKMFKKHQQGIPGMPRKIAILLCTENLTISNDELKKYFKIQHRQTIFYLQKKFKTYQRNTLEHQFFFKKYDKINNIINNELLNRTKSEPINW